jgi:hypothetical protein
MIATTHSVERYLALACKFARKLSLRWDIETESAVNFAVAVALDKWDGREGVTFETFLYRCVFLELKTLWRDEARREENETNATDIGDGTASLDNVPGESEASVYELIATLPTGDARDIADKILAGVPMYKIEAEYWPGRRKGEGIARAAALVEQATNE